MSRITEIEQYAQSKLLSEVAHDFDHADRVRRLGILIAIDEKFQNIDRVEAACILHDIGLGNTQGNRHSHGESGARMAASFLAERSLFEPCDIAEIENAIRYHCTNRTGSGKLLEILRDADIIDSLGAMGIIRTVRYWHRKRDYDPSNVRGATWGFTPCDFDVLFDNGDEIGHTIVEYLNFQISCFDNIYTRRGREIARPLAQFMRDYILQLEREVLAGIVNLKADR